MKFHIAVTFGFVAFLLPAVSFAATCPALSRGSTGPNVFAVQKILHNAYEGFPTPTGYFGPVTEAALKQWQKEHGIEALGIVGPKTRAAMKLPCPSTPSVAVQPSLSTPIQDLIKSLLAQVAVLQAKLAALLAAEGVVATSTVGPTPSPPSPVSSPTPQSRFITIGTTPTTDPNIDPDVFKIFPTDSKITRIKIDYTGMPRDSGVDYALVVDRGEPFAQRILDGLGGYNEIFAWRVERWASAGEWHVDLDLSQTPLFAPGGTRLLCSTGGTGFSAGAQLQHRCEIEYSPLGADDARYRMLRIPYHDVIQRAGDSYIGSRYTSSAEFPLRVRGFHFYYGGNSPGLARPCLKWLHGSTAVNQSCLPQQDRGVSGDYTGPAFVSLNWDVPIGDTIDAECNASGVTAPYDCAFFVAVEIPASIPVSPENIFRDYNNVPASYLNDWCDRHVPYINALVPGSFCPNGGTNCSEAIRLNYCKAQFPPASTIRPVTAPVQFTNTMQFTGSNYLERSPSVAGSLQKWTFSAWIKRSGLNLPQYIFGAGRSGSNYSAILFDANNALQFVHVRDGVALANNISSSHYTDTSQWHHVVVAADTTNSDSAQRVRLYIDGDEITSFATNVLLPQDIDMFIDDTVPHFIGSLFGSSNFTGLMADIHESADTSLPPSAFAQRNSDGIWGPKTYGASLGTNGFHLSFTNSNLGLDSWIGNNFTHR